MQKLLSRLLSMKEDALQWVSQVIRTEARTRKFLGTVVLTVLFVVMVWPYIVDAVWALRDAIDRLRGRAESVAAFREVYERQERCV